MLANDEKKAVSEASADAKYVENQNGDAKLDIGKSACFFRVSQLIELTVI